ncbi:MAG: carboxypeptidase-like regulatory domain-containing protein [Bacteroidetes bacterium]|nr:carboxypeptidase-like regulatory domain-containing protein [Bacteroidota bacterium]
MTTLFYRLTLIFTLLTGALTGPLIARAQAQPQPQEGPLIDGDFSDLPFPAFAKRIESMTSYHFYFDAAEVDTLRINLSVRRTPLPRLLDQAFKNTIFHYAIDPRNNVYITRLNAIVTTLTPGGSSYGNLTKDTTDASASAPSKMLRAALENKLFEIGTPSSRTGNATLVGYVRDIRNGEALVGAAVYLDNPPIGAITDRFGYFSLQMPRGRHTLQISSAGMKDTRRQILLHSDGKLNIEMEEFIPNLIAATVVAEKRSNIKALQMGVERINIKTIKQIPAVFGEADVLRAVLTLPGVTTVGEASTGFNVRGGSADQNLILFNDATIYNPSHLFGFFSAFNPDIIKGVELYKSSIPERYGGRLSSVLDVSTRDGNSKKLSGSAGIGPLTSKFTLEGPIVKDKTSFIISGRTTYSDWILRTLPNKEYNNSSASFYDVALHLTHNFNPKNSLYLTGYLSNDQFRLNSDTLYKYGNKNANIKWKHIFNNKLYSLTTAAIDHYQYGQSSSNNSVNAYDFRYGLDQGSFHQDFNYTAGSKHALDFGISSIYYRFNPGERTPLGSASLVTPTKVAREQALESAIYAGDQYSITSDLALNVGLRYSLYNYLGPHDVYDYVPGQPLAETTIKDTTHYSGGKNIVTYKGPEYRISLRYAFSPNTSVKLGYNTLRQYIHLLSNTTAISPADIWKLSDPHIAPQTGAQYSIGLYQNFRSNTIETSIEVYYKTIRNYLDYKSGANLLLNNHIETDVFNTRGRAYGAELLIKKPAGKLNGWLSYTYSRTQLKMDDPLAGEVINNGNYYPASFDKPHNVNFVGNYRFSQRYSLSLTTIYSTGRPITLPIATFTLGGSQRVYYSDRNQYRIPDYFRSDISFNMEGNHKVHQVFHNSWSFGVYNITARKNPYSIYFQSENGVIKGYKLSIFGTAIPFLSYNIRF